MNLTPIGFRELYCTKANKCRDSKNQAHFLDTELPVENINLVRLGRYPPDRPKIGIYHKNKAFGAQW